MTYTVYILQSELDGTYYVGCTTDVARRLAKHNTGGSRYTRSRCPWRVVHTEEFASESDALARERAIKSRGAQRYLADLARV